MSSLSLVATYDDIIRCQAALIEDDTEVAFRAFLESFDEYKAAFLHIQSDNNRLQRELDETITSMSVLETKLSHARRLLEMETRYVIKQPPLFIPMLYWTLPFYYYYSQRPT